MTPLYREFKGATEAGTGTHLIGFTDDTNILAYGKTTEEYALALERAFIIVNNWASVRGLSFNA